MNEECASNEARTFTPRAAVTRASALEKVLHNEPDVCGALGQASHEVRIPGLPVRDIDAHGVALAREFLLKVAPHAVEHLKLEAVFADALLARESFRGFDHVLVVRGDAVVDAAREQKLHAAHVVLVNIFFIREGDLRRLVVCALAEAYARGDFQDVFNVAARPSQVRLQDDADGVEVELGAQALEDVYGDLRDGRFFHVYADEVATARGLFDDGACVAVCEFGVNRESELRELDRDVRADACLLDALEYLSVLAHLALHLGLAPDAFVEVVEAGRAADGV